MWKRSMSFMLALVICGVGLFADVEARQAAGGEQYAGMWTGTYDGVATGQFEMILDKKSDSPMTGKVNVTTDAGNYSADLKSIVIEGTKMTTKYDYPLDPAAEIVMTATFDGTSAKGTWSLRAKGQADELAGGGIAVSKK